MTEPRQVGQGHPPLSRLAADPSASPPSAQSASGDLTRIRRYHQVGHRGVIVSMLVAVAMAAAFAGFVPWQWIAAWLGTFLAIGAIRLVVFSHVAHRVPEGPSLRWWGHLAVVLSLAQGLAWLPLLWFAHVAGAVSVTLLVGLVFGLFATGIVSIVGLYPPVYWAYVLPLVLGGFAWLTVIPDRQPAVALAFLVAAGFMLRGAIDSSRQLRRSVARRRETSELAQRLGLAKRRFQLTLASIGDAVITTGPDARVEYMNRAAEQLTGWTAEQASGRHLTSVLALVDSAPGQALTVLIETCLARGAPVNRDEDARLLPRGGDGEERLVQIGISPLQDDPGEVRGLVAVIRDVTELRGMARQVRHQGLYDTLTGLPNRPGFQAVLREVLADHARSEQPAVMCWFDLDRFKLVNDACGHAAGDEMLRQIAGQMLVQLPEGATLARMGGDEFALLLPGYDLDQATALAEGIRDEIARFRFPWADRVFNPGVSVGVVTVSVRDGVGAILAAADTACYIAKEQGSNRVHVADPDDITLSDRHGQVEWAAKVQNALDEDRFRLRYQRLEALQPDLPTKVEFLLTMIDDDGTLAGPAQFLPAAERFGLMPALDRHVVHMAMNVVVQCPRELAGVEQFAINLSGQSINDPEFLGFVLEAVRETGVDPTRLCFEITETAVISNMTRAQAFIARLREQGCRFSLDDFGSGLSSFGYLRALPVDCLKIDGQFVRNLATDQVDQSMVRCINQVGHTMGMLTVAEFVEDAAALERVRALGVDYAPGYAVHHPVLLS